MGRGRPKDPTAPYRVREHVIGKYRYAATRRDVKAELSDKTKRQVVHLGRLTENDEFLPNNTYLLLTADERAKLIFPSEWDLSRIHGLTSGAEGAPSGNDSKASDRLYGAVWLLERLAVKLDITQDLRTVFDGNEERVRDILTLAIFLYTTEEPFSHAEEWQDLEWYPSNHRLTPSVITRMLKSITDEERVSFTALRKKRLGNDNVCAVDSTTRSSRGKRLPDVAVGKSKDGGYAPQTTEVVVYSLSTHEPVYYQTFPGNVPDSKTMPTILHDLHHAGYTDLILVTDRGYESTRNLEACVLHNQKLITAANVGRKRALDKIRNLGDFNGAPPDMEWIPQEAVFGRQYDLAMTVKGDSGMQHKSDRMRLNLYFDPVTAAKDLVTLQQELAIHKAELEACIAENATLTKKEIRAYRYYKLDCDDKGHVKSFELDEKKVQKARETSGFFANITLGVDFTAEQALATYELRDEQEKYFYSMKTRIDCALQRNWNEKARRGARFVEFISLILVSWVKHVWAESEQLRDTFSFIRSMILTMRQIHRIDRPGEGKIVTLFLKKHMLICEQFGISVPSTWSHAYKSKEVKQSQKPTRKKKTKQPTAE